MSILHDSPSIRRSSPGPHTPRNSHVEGSPPKELMNPSLAIVVMSCDRYADLWAPFFEMFFRHWADCPCSVYLVANEKASPDPRVEVLRAGPDEGWSATLKRCLALVPADNVFTMIDDAFLVEPIQTAEFMRLYAWFIERDAHYLRLRAAPLPDVPVDGDVGEIVPGSMYRTSAVFAFWRRSTLIGLLDERENPWQFELDGVLRAEKIPGFYSVYRSRFSYLHGVDRGRWFPWAVARLRAAGVEVDTQARPIMPATEALTFAANLPKAVLMSRIPSAWRSRLIRWKRAARNAIHKR